MNEELSKRIDDLHRRFDDLGADIAARFSAVDKRIDDLRADVNQRLNDMNQRLNDMNQRLNDMNQRIATLTWIMSGWFTLLTAVLAVFGFLRR
jgi:tetrahydromethanopterin S-methyltransferase subunit G